MSEILDFREATTIADVNLGNGAKWIRVARLKSPGSCGVAGFITLSNMFVVNPPTPVLIAYSYSDNRFGSESRNRVKSVIGETSGFSKARIVFKEGNTAIDAFLEIWASRPSDSRFQVSAMPALGMEPCLELGVVPEGYTAQEFELTELGGVKCCTLFAVRQKGVQHERCYGTHKQGAKYHPAKCYALPGSNEEFRRVQAVGMLHYGRNDHLCKSSGRMGGLVEIRNSRSVGSRHCRNTEVVSSFTWRSLAQFQRYDLGTLEKSLNGVAGKEVAA